MVKWIGAIALGVAIGASAVLAVQRALETDALPARPAPAPPNPRSVLEPVSATPTPNLERFSLAEIQELPGDFERSAALHDHLRNADADMIEALLDEASALEQHWPKAILYSRYVDLAPRAAVEDMLTRDRGRSGRTRGLSALVAWAARDLDGTLAFVDTLGESMRTQAAKKILDETDGLSQARKSEIARRFAVESHLASIHAVAEAATNPSIAWQRALALEPGEPQDAALRQIASRWFDKDPPTALAAVATAPNPRRRRSWQRDLLGRWVGIDRRAALEWVLAQPPSETRRYLVAHVSALAARTSTHDMLEFAATLEPKDRRAVVERVLETWARSDPKAAIDALGEMADPQLTQMVEWSLVHAWARSDPVPALEWARARPVSTDRSQMLASILGNMAESDPRQAAALASDLEANPRSMALHTILSRWARDDPRAAIAWLDASPHKTPDAVNAVIGIYARHDLKGAVNWLRTQTPEAQQRAAPSITSHAADEPPEAALRLIERLDDPQARLMAGSRLISRWAREDPRTAIRAISRMEEPARPGIYQSAFSQWAEFDPDAATAHLGRIPPASRDAATHGVLQATLFAGDIDAAERLFERIGDEELRRAAATTMYMRLSDDPDRAARYRELSDIKVGEDGFMTIRVPDEGF